MVDGEDGSLPGTKVSVNPKRRGYESLGTARGSHASAPDLPRVTPTNPPENSLRRQTQTLPERRVRRSGRYQCPLSTICTRHQAPTRRVARRSASNSTPLTTLGQPTDAPQAPTVRNRSASQASPARPRAESPRRALRRLPEHLDAPRVHPQPRVSMAGATRWCGFFLVRSCAAPLLRRSAPLSSDTPRLEYSNCTVVRFAWTKCGGSLPPAKQQGLLESLTRSSNLPSFEHSTPQ